MMKSIDTGVSLRSPTAASDLQCISVDDMAVSSGRDNSSHATQYRSSPSSNVSSVSSISSPRPKRSWKLEDELNLNMCYEQVAELSTDPYDDCFNDQSATV